MAPVYTETFSSKIQRHNEQDQHGQAQTMQLEFHLLCIPVRKRCRYKKALRPLLEEKSFRVAHLACAQQTRQHEFLNSRQFLALE